MSNLQKYCQEFFLNNLGDDSEMLLLSNEIASFIDTGKKEDAFSVFYTFAEKFKLFGTGYDNVEILLDLLKEYENLSGQLLQRQRDHYSHSVFVFALGLAIYCRDSQFRTTYNDFYSLACDKGYSHFVYSWGLTSLFHDIGYPFQLTFDQLKEYCVNFFDDKKNIPFVMYGNMPILTSLNTRQSKRLKQLANIKAKSFDEIFAEWISLRLGYDGKKLLKKLKSRIVNPKFSIDHAYFSALLLANKMLVNDDLFSPSVLDVLTAILLHNSLNRYDIEDKQPISMQKHPLAYLLVLCDELQSWNRKGFGKSSRQDVLPQNIDIEIIGNEYLMTYKFDSAYKETQASIKMINELQSINGQTKFDQGIMALIAGGASLKSTYLFEDKTPSLQLVSDSRFFNLLEIAKSAHVAYKEGCTDLSEDFINSDFAQLSLELKLSNIHSAKSYGAKLSKVGCFYSDEGFNAKPIDSFDDITYFGRPCTDFLARDEHVRWVKDKISAGWKYGDSYMNISDDVERIKTRDKIKEHKDMLAYDLLPADVKRKDENIVNNMIALLGKNGDIKVYQSQSKLKTLLYIGVETNKDIVGENLDAELEKLLKEISGSYDVILGSSIITNLGRTAIKIANKLNIPYEIVLPNAYSQFIAQCEKAEKMQNYIATAHYLTELDNVNKIQIDQYLKKRAGRFIWADDLKNKDKDTK